MAETLATVTRVAVMAIVALVPIINPAGMAPIFLSLTAGATDRARAGLAARVALQAFLLLAAAMIGGSWVLVLFGLSLAEIRIAGGLLVIATAWHLMHTDQKPDAEIVALSQPGASEPLAHASFYPLTFPVTIGPGSLSIAVTLGAGTGSSSPAALLGAVCGGIVVAVTIYLAYRSAARLTTMLGRAATLVVLRLSAFILLAIGVKVLCDGLVERFTSGSA